MKNSSPLVSTICCFENPPGLQNNPWIFEVERLIFKNQSRWELCRDQRKICQFIHFDIYVNIHIYIFCGRFKSKTWHVHMKTHEDQLTTQLASIDHTTLHHPYLLVDLLFLAVAPNAHMIFALMKVYTWLIFKQPSWSSWFIPFTTRD